MYNLRTLRGQAAQIIKNDNGKYKIELYANGKWVKPAECYISKFDTENDAIQYFNNNKMFIHC